VRLRGVLGRLREYVIDRLGKYVGGMGRRLSENVGGYRRGRVSVDSATAVSVNPAAGVRCRGDHVASCGPLFSGYNSVSCRLGKYMVSRLSENMVSRLRNLVGVNSRSSVGGVSVYPRAGVSVYRAASMGQGRVIVVGVGVCPAGGARFYASRNALDKLIPQIRCPVATIAQ